MNTHQTMSPSTYAQMVSEAEAAVAAVQDPELRVVAFEKVLATLLEHGRPEAKLPKNSTVRSSPKRAKKSARRQGGGARKGPKGYVETLIDEGFFSKQRTIADVKAQLADQGYHIALTSLSGPLQALTKARRLRRQKATGDGKGTKSTYAYSNW